MSNRTVEQINQAAEYRLSHIAQIEALTVPGLNDKERIECFGKAAEFTCFNLERAYYNLTVGRSVCLSVWYIGSVPKSLFAHLPGCQCPVIEKLPGVPRTVQILYNWNPTAEQLEVFSRIQIERRFGALDKSHLNPKQE